MSKLPNFRVIAVLALAVAVVYLVVTSQGSRALTGRPVFEGPIPHLSPKDPHVSGAVQSIDEMKRRFPKVDYDAPESSDPSERVKRRDKGKHFDKLGGVSKEPTHYSSGLRSHWEINLPGLPVAQSSVVLTATTLFRGAYLSDDKGAVYTELSIKVEEVLKNTDDSVKKNSRIDINRLGGVVRYRTGEESLFFINGQNMPDVGKRYLFFLKAIPDSNDFTIVTAYELQTTGVIALDTPPQFAQYNGAEVAGFLEAVRQAVENSK